MKRTSFVVLGARNQRRAVFALAMGITLNVSMVVAQQPTAPAGGGGTPGGTTGGTPGGTTTPPGGGLGRPGTQQPTMPGQDGRLGDRNQFPEMQRMIFLSGKVLLEDGTPPPEPVVIERVCNGNPRPEGYTDSKGRFSFQLGQNQNMFSDASYGAANDGFGGGNDPFGQQRGNSNMGAIGSSGGRAINERDLMGCEIRAVLPGYRSEAVPLSGRRSMDNPDVGTIVLRRLANVEGTTISAIALKAPKDAKKALEKAHNLVKKNKADEALKEYEKAIAIYPQYSTAFYEMGRIYEAKNQPEEARKSYQQAIGIDSKYVNPYRQLAGMYVREQKWKEAAEFSQKAIKLDPVDFADSYFYNSVANYFLKNYDDAQASGIEAKKLDARNRIPKVHHLLGAINIERQDYAAAATHMKDYMKFLPAGQEADQMQKQIDELEKAVAARSGNR